MNPSATTKRILYADDDLDDQFFLEESLHAAGLAADVVFAADGEEAINYLQVTSAALPSLIILDLNMPKRNGKETLSFLKADQRYAGIPVVILSTSESKSDRKDCADLGAVSYFQKPFHHNGYVAIADRLKSFVEA